MDRRRNERSTRRLPVKYWEREGKTEPRRGYSTNISDGGMYVATGTPPTSRTRLRIEIGEPPDGFVVEGVVAHSKRVAPELRGLGQAGMGVRFLAARELVAELLGGVAAGLDNGGVSDESADSEDGVYRLRFPSPEDFLRVVRTDVIHGGLFVPTRHPAALDQRITVEVELPVAGLHPVRLPARVVQRIEPTSAGDHSNRLVGMGVQLEDRDAARKAFLPALEALEGRG